LNLQYDEPLSNFAFNFNLRRYAKAMAVLIKKCGAAVDFETSGGRTALLAAVGRCRLTA